MPRHRASFTTRRSPAEACAFVADLRHATWDPRVVSATKLTPGPVGAGARFVLRARLGCLLLDLPYTLVEHEPGARLVFAGARAGLRWRDEVRFAPHPGGALVTYDATLALAGPLALAAPLAAPLFRRAGDDAIAGLRAAL